MERRLWIGEFILNGVGIIPIFAAAIAFINARFSHHIILLSCKPERVCKPFRFGRQRMVKDRQYSIV